MTQTHLQFSLKSDPSCLCVVRGQLEKACAENGFDHEACDQIGLVVNEALANVIRHAYGQEPNRPIELSVDFSQNAVEFSLRDWGSRFDPTALLSRPKDPIEPGGLGLILMRQYMDRVQFLPQPDGMMLKLFRRKVRSG